MGLFSRLFGQNKKIRVQFIDNVNGTTFAVSEMLPDQLPVTFSIETTMHIKNVDWCVEQAIPENSIDFVKSGNLVLKMRRIEKISTEDLLFTLSSISNELPGISNEYLFNDFEISITEDEWRQNEFLNKSSMPLIDIEIGKINDIKKHHSEKLEAVTVFKECNVRDTIGEPGLSLSFSLLKEILRVKDVGNIKLADVGYVHNGFALKTDNTTFYGSLTGEIVTELGISQFSDSTIGEIMSITKIFELVFINWYHCDIVTDNV